MSKAFLKQVLTHQALRNSLIYLFSSVLRTGVPFLLLQVLTRYLSPGDYGILATYQTFIMIFSVVIGQNVAAAVSINFFHLGTKEFKRYFFNNYLLIIGYFAVSLVCVFFAKGLIENALQVPGNWMYVVVLIAFLDGLSQPLLVTWRAQKKPIPFGTYQVSQTVLNVALTLILVIVLGMNWEGRLLAIMSACLVFDIILVRIIVKGQYASATINRAYIKDAFLYGAPLIPHMLSGALIGGIDRLFIISMIGPSAAGLYVVGYQIGMIMDVIASSANQALYPFLIENLKKRRPATDLKVIKITYLYDMGIIAMGTVICLLSPLIVKYVVGDKFQNSEQFVRWIAIAYTIKGLYYIRVHYLFYEKKTHLLALCTFSAVLVSAACNYFLIKANGAIGAAQANVISFSVWALLTWMMAARVHPMPWLFFLKAKR